MVNWIKFIAIGLIFVLSLFSFRLALQSVDSSSRRGGLYIGLIIVISVAILSLFQSLFPTSLKLVSEDGEVAEAHSLATLKTDSRLNGNAALSFGYLTEEDEYVLMVKQDDGGYRRMSYPVDNAVVYEDAEADDARVEVVDQYVVIRETYSRICFAEGSGSFRSNSISEKYLPVSTPSWKSLIESIPSFPMRSVSFE